MYALNTIVATKVNYGMKRMGLTRSKSTHFSPSTPTLFSFSSQGVAVAEGVAEEEGVGLGEVEEVAVGEGIEVAEEVGVADTVVVAAEENVEVAEGWAVLLPVALEVGYAL